MAEPHSICLADASCRISHTICTGCWGGESVKAALLSSVLKFHTLLCLKASYLHLNFNVSINTVENMASTFSV